MMCGVIDVVYFKGKLLKSGKYELRIYIYSEYKENLEKYAGRGVEGLLIIRDREERR